MTDDYTADDIEASLEQYGELIVVLDSDAYPDNVELHKHDTEIHKDPEEIVLTLSDGHFSFKPSAIEGMGYHEQSTDDLGL